MPERPDEKFDLIISQLLRERMVDAKVLSDKRERIGVEQPSIGMAPCVPQELGKNFDAVWVVWILRTNNLATDFDRSDIERFGFFIAYHGLE